MEERIRCGDYHKDAKLYKVVKGIVCHVTGTGYDVATKKVSELGVACEACHGPGGEHIAASKEDRKKTIINPKNLAAERQPWFVGSVICSGPM